MNNDDTINLANEIDATKSVMEATEKQIGTLDKAMQDLAVTMAVLNERSNFSNTDMLVMIGSGMFLKAKVEDAESIMFPIGSDVYTETDAETAKKKIEENISGLQKTMETLVSRQTELRIRYENLVAIAQSVSQQETKQQ